jgi:hypothetical protein
MPNGIMLRVIMISAVFLSGILLHARMMSDSFLYRYAECHYTEWRRVSRSFNALLVIYVNSNVSFSPRTGLTLNCTSNSLVVRLG